MSADRNELLTMELWNSSDTKLPGIVGIPNKAIVAHVLHQDRFGPFRIELVVYDTKTKAPLEFISLQMEEAKFIADRLQAAIEYLEARCGLF